MSNFLSKNSSKITQRNMTRHLFVPNNDVIDVLVNFLLLVILHRHEKDFDCPTSNTSISSGVVESAP